MSVMMNDLQAVARAQTPKESARYPLGLAV